MTMTRARFTIALAASMMLAVAAWGVPTKEDGKEAPPGAPKEEVKTYKNIAERNVFGLKTQVAVVTNTPPPPPAANVKLTGVTTLFGQRRAILVITPPGKPPESRMIKEGDREGDLEVLSINELTGVVRVRNNNQETDLSFEANGIKPPTAAPPPAAPPPGAMPTAGLPPGTVLPGQAGIVMPQGRPGMTGVPGMTNMPPSLPTPTRILRQ